MHLILPASLSQLLRVLPKLLIFSFLLLFLVEVIIVFSIVLLSGHVVLVVQGIKEDAALLQLLLHVVAVYQHEIAQQLIFVLVDLGRYWEDQTDRKEEGTTRSV